MGLQGSQLSPIELLPLCWNVTPWVAQPGECAGVILDIAELWAQGAKSGAVNFKGPLLHLLKDVTLKLVLPQRNTQLEREVELGAGGSGLWCLPGRAASAQTGEGVLVGSSQSGLCIWFPAPSL